MSHHITHHLQDEVRVGRAGEVQAGQHQVGHGLQRGRERHRFTRAGRTAEDEGLVGGQPRLEHLHVPAEQDT